MQTFDWILVIVVLIGTLLYHRYIYQYWLRCKVSKVKVTRWQILKLQFKKVNVQSVIFELIKAKRANVAVSLEELGDLFLAGNNISNIINGLIYAKKIDGKLTIEEAVKLDAQKIDVVQCLKKTLN